MQSQARRKLALLILLSLGSVGCVRHVEVDIKHPFVMRGIQCEEHADLKECSCVITDKILDANRKTYIYVCKQPTAHDEFRTSMNPPKVGSIRCAHEPQSDACKHP